MNNLLEFIDTHSNLRHYITLFGRELSMNHDYYADLDTQDKFNPQYDGKKGASCLASGFVDQCIICSCRKEERDKKGKKIDHKNDARKYYQNKIRQLSLEFSPDIQSLFLEPDFSTIPSHWFPLEIPFTLQTPCIPKTTNPSTS